VTVIYEKIGRAGVMLKEPVVMDVVGGDVGHNVGCSCDGR
jgi:hypothetical protein